MSRLIRSSTMLLLLSVLKLQGIQAAVFGTIFSQPNNIQDFFVHIICFDTLSNHDCCAGASRALATLSLVQELECEKHVSLIPTQDHRTIHSLSFSSKQVNTTGWISPNEEILHNSSFSFLWDNEESNMILQNVPLKQVMAHLSTETRSDNSQTVALCIESSLSGSGMHREINYKVHSNRDLKALNVLIHLPADVFVNKEDAFAHGFNTQLIEILTTDTIDLEEPTFASPPHALVLRLGDTRQDASFSLKLHLRYPIPLVTGDFRRILLTPALSIFATVEGDEPVTVLADDSCAQLIQIWTASGHVDDSWFVLVATVGFALVGAAVMLSDLSKVTQWI